MIRRMPQYIQHTNIINFFDFIEKWPIYCLNKGQRQLFSIKRKNWGHFITMDITHSTTILDRIRHKLNPLHIYCRLTCLGISSKVARDICKIYEAGFYKPTLGR